MKSNSLPTNTKRFVRHVMPLLISRDANHTIFISAVITWRVRVAEVHLYLLRVNNSMPRAGSGTGHPVRKTFATMTSAPMQHHSMLNGLYTRVDLSRDLCPEVQQPRDVCNRGSFASAPTGSSIATSGTVIRRCMHTTFPGTGAHRLPPCNM